ncbi:hypothetical protein Cenrod_2156 [Candidatus Symbiobacter mobilis CR]|uniref:Uncharacterized protein n=2 Tax=Candidatus Symbiobacter TaxID=1436289 RepID=U5NA77_9BURK|nr:hypothetical protein Cenrod_2156 [Candidatus Symbiobacter mobilis CR]
MADDACKNPHRLLLLYAVECGLKAVWLKRQGRSLFDRMDIDNTGHDLRQLLKALQAGSGFSLPAHLELRPVTHNQARLSRHGDISILHQVWRYGGECIVPTDAQCEHQLRQVLRWIQGELR